MTNCLSRNSVGSACAEPDGHPGEHRSRYGVTWTDESVKRAIAAMLDKAKRWNRD